MQIMPFELESTKEILKQLLQGLGVSGGCFLGNSENTQGVR